MEESRRKQAEKEEELERKEAEWDYYLWFDPDDPEEYDKSGTTQESWDRRAKLYAKARARFEIAWRKAKSARGKDASWVEGDFPEIGPLDNR